MQGGNTQVDQLMIIFFLSATMFKPFERIWKSWAPPKNVVCSSGWQHTRDAGP
jgi:hypothetical protein